MEETKPRAERIAEHPGGVVVTVIEPPHTAQGALAACWVCADPVWAGMVIIHATPELLERFVASVDGAIQKDGDRIRLSAIADETQPNHVRLQVSFENPE